jgi:hypothetical protein
VLQMSLFRFVFLHFDDSVIFRTRSVLNRFHENSIQFKTVKIMGVSISIDLLYVRVRRFERIRKFKKLRTKCDKKDQAEKVFKLKQYEKA